MTKSTFQFIILELIEKTIRLENYIRKNSSKNRKNSNDAVIEIFQKSLDSLYLEIEYLILEVNSLDNNSTSDEIFCIQQLLATYYETIKKMHEELSVLNTDWLKLETYTFVEQIYDNYFKHIKAPEVNIILSDNYSFIETNLEDRFAKIINSLYDNDYNYITEDSPAIVIPKIEYSNPLVWTFLVHELAHLNKDEIKKLCSNPKLIPSDLNNKDKAKYESILKKWAKEIYCDILAINIMGPAYFLTLMSYALLESLITGFGAYSSKHPPFEIRLELLHYYIDKNNEEITTITLNDANKSIHSYLYEMSEVINENLFNSNKLNSNKPLLNKLMIFESFLRKELIKVSDNPKQMDSIYILVKSLKKKIPIGGYRIPTNDINDSKKIKTKDFNLDEFEEIKRSLTDRKTELWEIINAGWVYKVENLIPYGQKIFFKNKKNWNINKRFKKYSKKLDLLDDRLLVSIETSKLIDLIEN